MLHCELSAEVHNRVVRVVRRSGAVTSLPPLPIMDTEPIWQPENQVVVFEEAYSQDMLSNVYASVPDGALAIKDEAHFEPGAGPMDAWAAVDVVPTAVRKRSDAMAHYTVASATRSSALSSPLVVLDESVSESSLPSDRTLSEPSRSHRDSESSVPGSADGIEDSMSSLSISSPNKSASQSSASVSRPATSTPQRRKAKPLNLRRDAAHYEGKHVFVFVHGYQGNSWDMRMIKVTNVAGTAGSCYRRFACPRTALVVRCLFLVFLLMPVSTWLL